MLISQEFFKNFSQKFLIIFPVVKQLHHDAWLEETVLWFVDYLEKIHLWDPLPEKNLKEGFKIWRENSLSPPSSESPGEIEETFTGMYDYLLGRLSVEFFDYDEPEKKLIR